VWHTPNNRRISSSFSLDRHNSHQASPSFECHSANQRGSLVVEKAKLDTKVIVLAFATPEFTNAEKVKVNSWNQSDSVVKGLAWRSYEVVSIALALWNHWRKTAPGIHFLPSQTFLSNFSKIRKINGFSQLGCFTQDTMYFHIRHMLLCVCCVLGRRSANSNSMNVLNFTQFEGLFTWQKFGTVHLFFWMLSIVKSCQIVRKKS